MNTPKLWCALLLIAVTSIAGCTSMFSEDSLFGDNRFTPENRHKTVTALSDGRYRVVVRTRDVEPFGGLDFRVSVPRYLDHHRLRPPECRDGVEYLYGGSAQGQGGYIHTAVIRCQNGRVSG